MLLILLALAQATVLPAPPEVSAESATQPLTVLDCRIFDDAMNPSNLLLESQGTRGFDIEGQVRSTEAQFVVIADQRNALRGVQRLFDNLNLQRYSGQWHDRRLTSEGDAPGTFVTVEFQDALNDRAHIQVALTSPPFGSASPIVTHTGFCGVGEIVQRPLTQQEARELELQ